MLTAVIVLLIIVGAITFGVMRRISDAKGGGPAVVVKTVKGNKAAQRQIRSMLTRGYELEAQSSRKVAWTPLTGLWTRKQKHTLTFIKR